MGASLLRGLLLYVCFAFLFGFGQASLDISAFEYQRKFNHHLDLGECPNREMRVISSINDTTHFEETRCNLRHPGTVTTLPRELNDSRNVLIQEPEEIVTYLGLCGGEAASFLGILNFNRDCVAVEIASRLTFNEKTMVRAFVGYYRKAVDILDSADNESGLDMDRYYMYRDKVYLKHRSYGTMEVIFVQWRFKSSKQAEQARKVEIDSPLMSQYMKAIDEKVGTPKRTTVINLSTATTKGSYEIKRFNAKEWARALRHVQVQELFIRRTRELINLGKIKPHLKYRLFPFIEERDKTGFRVLGSSDPVSWETTSLLEVQLRQAISIAKKTSKKCKRNRKKPCRRIRELRRKLITTNQEIHEGRSKWHTFSPLEKKAFATKYSAKVKSYSSVTKKLVKTVREMRKREKTDKYKRKTKRPNEINRPDIRRNNRNRMRRMHSIRHGRRRSKFRKG
jgi:hypothetical protein